MARVVLSGFIEVPASDLSAVREELPKHIEATLAEEGCIVFEVVEDASTPGRFHVYEEFSSKEAFEQHQRRTTASRWGKVAAGAKRHYSVSERGAN
jgi:quinol monooxygenase YgiN